MKAFVKKHNFFLTAATIAIIRFLALQVVSAYAHFIPLQHGFLGPLRRANFDGAHYLVISKFNYGTFEQAFFPLFPLLIHIVRPFFLNRSAGAFLIVYVSFIVAMVLFLRLALLDVPRKKALWAFLLFLLFPTSFFLGSIYTESLFLALSLGSFYAMRKEKFFLAAVLAGFASATRIIGVFLCVALLIELYQHLANQKIPLLQKVSRYIGYAFISLSGLFAYMMFLWRRYGDPLLFIHVQPSFGAHRTAGTIVLLPQVFFRYVKIFLSVTPQSHDFLIALLEFATFCLVVGVLLFNWRKIRLSYLVYSLPALVLPTLTGTLSSMPRYVLIAFPFFFLLGDIKWLWLKLATAIVFGILLVILLAFFLQGYFIA